MIVERIKSMLAEGKTPSQVYREVYLIISRNQFLFILRRLAE